MSKSEAKTFLNHLGKIETYIAELENEARQREEAEKQARQREEEKIKEEIAKLEEAAKQAEEEKVRAQTKALVMPKCCIYSAFLSNYLVTPGRAPGFHFGRRNRSILCRKSPLKWTLWTTQS